MIDEIRETETETVTQTAQPETFDLDAAVAAYVAEQDQREAAVREANQRAEQEKRERAIALLEAMLDRAFPGQAKASIGIGPAEWKEWARRAEATFVVDGEKWVLFDNNIIDHDALMLIAPPSAQPYRLTLSNALAGVIQRVAERRIDRRAEEEEQRARAVELAADEIDAEADFAVATTVAPANGPWEPQLLGSDHYRSTYVLNADKGCGSLSQHQMTLAEITRAGDVILSRVYFGRAGMKRAIEEIQLDHAELRALWPLWQQATAEKAEADETAAESEATEDIPF